MSLKSRSLALILSLALLLCEAGALACPDMPYSYAAETDNIKAITVFTDFYKAGVGNISSDVGLDTLVSPSDAAGYKITWKSSNTDIATVDSTGHVHAVLKGAYAGKDEARCTITATVTLNGKTASDSVKVNVVRSGSDYKSVISDSVQPLGNTTGELLICFDASCSNSKIRSIVSEYDASCEKIKKTSDDTKVVLATLNDEEDQAAAEETASGLESEDAVEYVQPNYIYTLDAEEADPYYNETDQYFHFDTGIDKAWQIIEEKRAEDSKDTACTTVAVLDSGVDTTHPDLVSESGTNLILNDGKYTSFRNGSKNTGETADPVSSGHGTHVTGIIGALYGNGEGGAGAASGKNNDLSKVLTIGVTDKSNELDTYDIISAIDYAGGSGARVINMSFGGESYDRALDNAITRWHSKGVVFVASAGNENSDYSENMYSIAYPSDLKEVISVCNTNASGLKHSTSNYGFAKDISAPGVNILSTTPEKVISSVRYTKLTGTSMSAPVISSVCALILDANPDLTADEVRNIICGTASDPNSYFKTKEMGYGKVDAAAAVKAAYSSRTSVPEEIAIKIKTPYRSKANRIVTGTSVMAAFSRLSPIKTKSLKKSARIIFSKSACTVTHIKTTRTIDAYTGKTLKTVKEETSKKRTETGVKYKVGIKKKGGSWKYYTIPFSEKTTSKYKVRISGSRIKVQFTGLEKNQTYYLRVRALRKINGALRYGKWTSSRKVTVQ